MQINQKKHQAAERTDQNYLFEANCSAPRLKKANSSEASDLEHQNSRKPNMQPREYDDQPKSSNGFSASNKAICQPLGPTFGARLGILGLMRGFVKQKPFFGSREEDLDSAVSKHEIILTICEVKEDEKTQGPPSVAHQRRSS